MLTTKVRTGGSDYTLGWHTLKIATAKRDSFDNNNFHNLTFEGYPETFRLRVYEVSGGDDWKTAQLYRFANAGIVKSLENGSGETLVQIDDNPQLLVGKLLNVLFVEDGEFTKIFNRFAPTVFENEAEKFTEASVQYWKDKAEKSHANSGGKQSKDRDEDIPF